METDGWINHNGTLKPIGQPIISGHSRGLMYGDGCFETLRSYSGRCLALEKHLNRLKEGVQFLGMVLPDLLKPDVFGELLYDLLEKNGLLKKDAVVRVQVWREGGRGYQTEPQSPAGFTIMASRYPADKPVTPATLATTDIRRVPNQALPSRFKLSNGINYITAVRKAQAKGADDALMLTMDEYVSETTIANLFWIKEDTICTPAKACDLLPGITRGILIEILSNAPAYKVEEGAYRLEEILDAGAVWMCNSVRELVSVGRIDDQAYPVRHPVFEDIKNEFTAYRDQKLIPLT